MASGGLVGDDLITDLVRDRLRADDSLAGFILDGYPRTVSQAIALDGMRAPTSLLVAVIDVPDDAAARYWAGRLAVALDWPQEVHRFPRSVRADEVDATRGEV
jgi:adenylate kinase family enzyme